LKAGDWVFGVGGENRRFSPPHNNPALPLPKLPNFKYLEKTKNYYLKIKKLLKELA